MNITSASQSMGFMPVSQSAQDSREQEIQKQIMNLQEKMRDVTYNNEMSSDEKKDKKKALQEQIQNLNSELKQYQLQKRQEEAEKRQEEVERKRREEAARMEENSNAEAGSGAESAQTEEEIVLFPESNASKAMLSNSNTKEHLSNLQRIRNDLEGKLRTADSEEEKARLRKRISRVSKGMGVKVQKIKDTIADGQADVQPQKNKSSKTQRESREDSAVQGKVLITRKKD